MICIIPSEIIITSQIAKAFTTGVNLWFKYNFGKIWELVEFTFDTPNDLHLSIRKVILAHEHQAVKAFSKIWVSYSSPVVMAASSANWNQCLGFKKWLGCRKPELSKSFRLHILNISVHQHIEQHRAETTSLQSSCINFDERRLVCVSNYRWIKVTVHDFNAFTKVFRDMMIL